MRLTSPVNVFDTTVRTQRARQHVSGVADNNIRLAGAAEELRRRPSRVVAVHHHDVRERGLIDAAPVRRAEAHVPLVLEQPDAGKSRKVRRDELRRRIFAAVVDHEYLVGQ